MPRAPNKPAHKASGKPQRPPVAAPPEDTSTSTSTDTDTLYFYSTKSADGYLSQWHASVFKSREGDEYSDSEQYMMHQKALLFAPESTYPALIMAAKNDPKECKRLGRLIPGFDEARWKQERDRIVEEASYFKFSQNRELRLMLLATGDRELVEAAPRDRVWGIGFGKENAPMNRHRWGLNLLGKALMRVRDRLRLEMEEEVQEVAGE